MLIVERINDDIVTIENGDIKIEAALSLFAEIPREGDIIAINRDGLYVRDTNATEKRRKEILKLQNDMWN